jgi:hypothetical protein
LALNLLLAWYALLVAWPGVKTTGMADISVKAQHLPESSYDHHRPSPDHARHVMSLHKSAKRVPLAPKPLTPPKTGSLSVPVEKHLGNSAPYT